MAGADAAGEALKPRLVLRVGVTGHRTLPVANATHRRIDRQVREALDEMARSLEAVAERAAETFRPAAPLLRLVSPLAEGADRLVAEALFERGGAGGVAVDLQCVLPFPVEVYEQDFGTAASKAEFRELLQRASAVVELDGVADRERPGEGAPSPAALAYLAVGEYVLEHSDVLVAIWDGKPARGVGGTAEVVGRARRLGLPVLHIASEGEEAPPRILYGPGSPIAPRRGAEATTLGDLAAHLLLPPGEGRLARLEAPTREDRERETDQAGRLRRWFAEPDRPGRSLYERVWAFFGELLGGRSAAPAVTAEPAEVVRRAMAPFRAVRERSARLARHYAGRYRGAFLLNYLLGASAVVLALVSVLAEHSRVVLGVLELVALVWILGNVRVGKRAHARFLDYRLLAEQLRHTLYLFPLGRITPGYRMPAHHATHDPRAEWTNWVYQSTVREIGLPAPVEGERSVRVDRTYVAAVLDAIRDVWIAGQIAYHERSAERSGRIAHRLELAVWILAIGTVLFCGGHVVLEILHESTSPPSPVWPALLLAALPAFLAALHGIRSQGEFVRLALRSTSMRWHLEQLQARLASLEDQRGEPFSRRVLTAAVITGAQQMMEEAIDWRILAKIQEVGPA